MTVVVSMARFSWPYIGRWRPFLHAGVRQSALVRRQTTGVGGSAPLSTAMTLSAQSVAIASRVLRVAEPMCGTSTVLGSATSSAGTAGSSS